MTTLKDHTILFDDQCPLCDLYTSGFVKSGMLDQHGRREFSQAGAVLDKIDRYRACDEIALVNNKTGEVTYGVDSLMTVIGNSFPVFKPLFSNKLFYGPMKKLYSFISYNRKVIIPPAAGGNGIRCEPSFNIKYRVAYLVFAWLVTSVILHAYAQTLSPFLPPGTLFREMLVCGGQIAFQAVVMRMVHRNKILTYLGNMMTISLAGGLALLVLMPAVSSGFSAWISLAGFALVVTLMLLEHVRRVRVLGLHGLLTVSWVLYRLIVLVAIECTS